MSPPVLAVRDLRVSFPSEAGRVDAVRGVAFDLLPGRTLGIVGESGSGKTVTSLALMGLLPDYAAVSGSITLIGRELLGLDDRRLSKVRGNELGMVFQDPMSSLTPIFSVGRQIVEALQIHQDLDRDVAWKRAVELLDLVGIPDAATRARSFPHEFSGGMRQRVVVAIAIANDPRVIIADEPTTALDLMVQAQVLTLIRQLIAEHDISLLMISHDLSVLADVCDRLAVMYAGRLVEAGPSAGDFQHPYSQALAAAFPTVGDPASRLAPRGLAGDPPDPQQLPGGCAFHPRCPVALDSCSEVAVELRPAGSRRTAACVLVGEGTC
jgi:peptide/nickel transport system ATP-binding protein